MDQPLQLECLQVFFYFFNYSFLSLCRNVFSSFTGSVDIEPGLVLTYLQNLKSSEESLKEQVGWIP